MFVCLSYFDETSFGTERVFHWIESWKIQETLVGSQIPQFCKTEVLIAEELCTEGDTIAQHRSSFMWLP